MPTPPPWWTDTQLAEGGNGLQNYRSGGLPFAIPQNGLEAIWNQITRYRDALASFGRSVQCRGNTAAARIVALARGRRRSAATRARLA